MKQYKDTPYYITEDGRIFRDENELSTSLTNKGYKTHRGSIGNVRKHISIHRAVAELYIPNPNNLPQVDHLDCNKSNNHYTNLEWVTNKENRDRAISNGLMKFGTDYEHTKLTEENVKYIRENYIAKHSEFGNKALSKKFGVGSAQISRIVNKTRWKHI